MGLDEELFEAIHDGWRSAALDPFMVALSFLGLLYVWALFALPLGWRSGRRMALRLLLVLAVDALVIGALKFAIQRPRPGVEALPVPGDTPSSDFSFPSGHSSRSAAAVAWLSTRHRRALLLVPYAVLIGISRVYIGVHWPTDVLAGLLIGAGIGLAMSRVFQLPRYRALEDRFWAGVDRRLLGRGVTPAPEGPREGS